MGYAWDGFSWVWSGPIELVLAGLCSALLTLIPGCTCVAPGTYLVWGSNITRCSPDTRLGRSVKWYTAVNETEKRGGPDGDSLTAKADEVFRACPSSLLVWVCHKTDRQAGTPSNRTVHPLPKQGGGRFRASSYLLRA